MWSLIRLVGYNSPSLTWDVQQVLDVCALYSDSDIQNPRISTFTAVQIGLKFVLSLTLWCAVLLIISVQGTEYKGLLIMYVHMHLSRGLACFLVRMCTKI